VAPIIHHFIHSHSLPSYENYPSTFGNFETAPKFKILVDLEKKIPKFRNDIEAYNYRSDYQSKILSYAFFVLKNRPCM
jgi:hypothetical protein